MGDDHSLRVDRRRRKPAISRERTTAGAVSAWRFLRRNPEYVDLSPGATVVSDGLGCFTAVTAQGCAHHPIATGSGPGAVAVPAFKWVNTTLGNLKNTPRGTYHAIRPKHVPRYLAAFQYRYNRRYRLADMIEALGRDALRTPPMPYRLLKLAEVSA